MNKLFFTLLFLLYWIFTIVPASLAGEVTPLWISLTPDDAAKNKEICLSHVPAQQQSRPEKSTAKNQENKTRPITRFESEHRPKPIRTYWIGPMASKPFLSSFIQKADGTILPIDTNMEGNTIKLSFPAAMGDGPMHGPNYVYAVEQYVSDKTMIIRSAKWLTIQHSCGWGHKQKFNPARQVSKPCPEAPFEVVIQDLWDSNFHSKVMSGNTLNMEVLFRGQPAGGAKILFTSEKGWTKELFADSKGRAEFTLIRDYYPDSWALFKRDEQGEFKVEVRYYLEETGEFKNQPYNRIEMITTFPWHYSPARREYNSLAYGLILVVSTMFISGFGIFTYRERRKKVPATLVFDEK